MNEFKKLLKTRKQSGKKRKKKNISIYPGFDLLQ